MKIVLLTLAMIGGQTTIPVSERVPQLNVEATCKATVATDKAMGLDLAQSYDDCMRDENSALQQLHSVWLTNSDSLRNRCEGEATAGGSDSYVDLLTCMQMADWAKSTPDAPKLKGASKNRNKL
ncbi:hypothetical protein QCM77_31020 [Bradyrhizobium sp. SSUT18]|uniref:hypothetical protein n=1 Tax=unclassified Bradyrhizobium TaxID=2631580 RepID=UPI00244D1D70|nr:MULTISPECIES: hypothetical protein [unclassified Bradyrhizobium]MDH2343463.1 hypothetical protein [Bradyrhizobium sp. SSUT77]MDH2354978.1 hypothetical protein [Bradyrhizobium sp. SSUT112]MDH2404352.1 hypothetical protein [Bradyrhizobium sp. SSUT18]